MLECPACAIRQYAPASYGVLHRSVACEGVPASPPRAAPGGRWRTTQILALAGDHGNDARRRDLGVVRLCLNDTFKSVRARSVGRQRKTEGSIRADVLICSPVLLHENSRRIP